eukprot:669860-Hanusia_phi.AAC.2
MAGGCSGRRHVREMRGRVAVGRERGILVWGARAPAGGEPLAGATRRPVPARGEPKVCCPAGDWQDRMCRQRKQKVWSRCMRR